jgi:hypothetical protein
MRLRVLCLALVCGVGLPAVAAAQAQHYAVIIQGASGEEEFAVQHRAWVDSMVAVLRDRFKYDAQHLLVLAEKPGPGELPGDAASVKSAIAGLVPKLKETDVLLVMLIGHGTTDGTTGKFNLVGPDLDVSEWAALLKPVRARLVFVDASSASSFYLKGMAGPEHITITATAQPAEKYHTMFADAFAQALSSPEADLDKNGRISIWEAFSYASRLVKQYYEQKGLLQTEHAALDDNGDGVWKTGSADDHDGMLASLTYLDNAVETKSTDPQLQFLAQQQEDLLSQFEQLKRKKATMKAEEYDAEMERLLTEIALLSREIRKRGGGF